MKFVEYFDNGFLERNQITLENVTAKRDTLEFTAYYHFDHVLPVNEFEIFVKCYERAVADFRKYPIHLVINYGNLSLDDERLYLSYLSFLLRNCCDYSLMNLSSANVCFNNGAFKMIVPNISKITNAMIEKVCALFSAYGLKVTLDVEQINREEVNQILETKVEDDKRLMEQVREAQEKANTEKPVEVQKTNKKYNPIRSKEITQIKDIPSTQTGIDEYVDTKGPANFTIEGEVFIANGRRIKENCHLYEFSIYDGTDSIMVKRFARDNEKESFDQIKVGKLVKVQGVARFDSFAKEVTIQDAKIEVTGDKEITIPLDEAPEKRVELHMHSNMSALDAVCEATNIVNRAIAWGHKAVAITDHDGIYSYHDIMTATDGKDIKPIYGVELGFVDDEKCKIAYSNDNIDLHEASYVVFDLETTGFSVKTDDIIQIGAYKVYHDQVVDSLSILVKPTKPIPERITVLTSITNEMVKDADTIDIVLPKFLEFSKDCILVAHNATFDMSHLYENIRKLGLPFRVIPCIDTLALARNFYGTELKRFNLEALAKYFKVNQEHHHLADDDARVTAEIFIQMLHTLYKEDITNYSQINSHINENEAYKHVIPSHINLLVQNQTGYKNMFKALSDALTVHFYNETRLLKSVLTKYREGILVGSGCVNGEIFQLALERSDEDLERAMEYYDYIELQPYDVYACALNKNEAKFAEVEDTTDYNEVAKTAMLRIIAAAKKLGKIVVATSDAHYIDKEQKKYRDIYISAPQLGGGIHSLANCKETPLQHFRTTNEMLEAFSFLGEDLAKEIVITNTNKIADMIELVVPFKDKKEDLYSPRDDEFKDSLGVPSIKDDLMRIVSTNVHENYGENLPKYVSDRLDKELNSIINNGYSPIYYLAYLLVKNSNEDGYVVGSRGSVGSSFVATMMNITEVNPLAPHYYCKKCHFSAFKFNTEQKEMYPLNEQQQEFDKVLQSVDSGYDLPNAVCPCCGEKLKKDGQDIPFETFLGFAGDKTPDIDLNFSGLYQPTAHEYIRTLMGPENAFRAGTVGTVAENTAIGYVKGYTERKNIILRNTEIKRIAKHIEGVRRSTGQHPGGIVVVPSYKEIYDVTPIQYPANDTTASWRTTHFDYHSFEANLLKLDILGHDDPTTLRYIFDYVEAHPEEFPFKTPQEVPIDDQDVRKMFSETKVLGLSPADINCEVATFAIPEFGTKLSRNMLVETKPNTFADLVKISGLSHGTDVWQTNSQDLVNGKTDFGKIDFKDIIGCRDDIMVDLIRFGIDAKTSFDIMEFVRKGKAAKHSNDEKWNKYVELMKACPAVPEWYPWSCGKIAYMFPKAHAVAYVLMAMRIAWFKLHKPLLFYSAFFTIRGNQFEPDIMLQGLSRIKSRIIELENLKSTTAKDDDLLTMYQVAVEMIKRGYVFLPVDIRYSHATHFIVEEKGLRLPFVSMQGLGESVANDVMEKRNEAPFTSKQDVMNRTKLNKTLFDKMNAMGCFADLKDEEDEPENEEDFTTGLFKVFEE